MHRAARDQWLPTWEKKESIPIAISIWRNKTSGPNQAFHATLDNAPERRRFGFVNND